MANKQRPHGVRNRSLVFRSSRLLPKKDNKVIVYFYNSVGVDMVAKKKKSRSRPSKRKARRKLTLGPLRKQDWRRYERTGKHVINRRTGRKLLIGGRRFRELWNTVGPSAFEEIGRRKSRRSNHARPRNSKRTRKLSSRNRSRSRPRSRPRNRSQAKSKPRRRSKRTTKRKTPRRRTQNTTRKNGKAKAKRKSKRGLSVSWEVKYPRNQRERRETLAKGGRKCFLQPKQLKYPICPKGSKTPSCQGILAAKRRAASQRNRTLVNKAGRLQQQYGC